MKKYCLIVIAIYSPNTNDQLSSVTCRPTSGAIVTPQLKALGSSVHEQNAKTTLREFLSQQNAKTTLRITPQLKALGSSVHEQNAKTTLREFLSQQNAKTTLRITPQLKALGSSVHEQNAKTTLREFLSQPLAESVRPVSPVPFPSYNASVHEQSTFSAQPSVESVRTGTMAVYRNDTMSTPTCLSPLFHRSAAATPKKYVYITKATKAESERSVSPVDEQIEEK